MDSIESSTPAAALSDSELTELVRAERALVAAPWVVWDDGDIGTGYPVERIRRNRRTGTAEPTEVESLWLLNGHSPISDQLVILRNSAPGLLARLRAAEARITELEQELELAGTPF